MATNHQHKRFRYRLHGIVGTTVVPGGGVGELPRWFDCNQPVHAGEAIRVNIPTSVWGVAATDPKEVLEPCARTLVVQSVLHDDTGLAGISILFVEL